MAESGYNKPLPIADGDSQPYWEAARDHQLRLQRCQDCDEFVFYPRVICPHCGGARLQWQTVSGRGTIYSFTVPRVPITPAYEDAVPYVVVLVDLEEGPRMMANLVECAPDDVRVDAAVEVVFQDVTPDVTLPQFRLTAAAAQGGSPG